MILPIRSKIEAEVARRMNEERFREDIWKSFARLEDRVAELEYRVGCLDNSGHGHKVNMEVEK